MRRDARSAVLEIDRTVSSPVGAPLARCAELLADVEGYPRWASLIESAAAAGDAVQLRAAVLGVSFEMTCSLEVAEDRVVLARIPHDADDEERFRADWTLAPGEVRLHVHAVLDAPGPARLIRGRVERRIADDLLADFVRAADAA
jgi:hypothetical protein